MPISTSERGFNGYADFLANGDHTRVRVYESSAAMAPHVWVNIEPSPPVGNEGETAHLNVEQAILLRDALSEWLDEIPTRWEDGEQFLPKKDVPDKETFPATVKVTIEKSEVGLTVWDAQGRFIVVSPEAVTPEKEN